MRNTTVHRIEAFNNNVGCYGFATENALALRLFTDTQTQAHFNDFSGIVEKQRIMPIKAAR